MNNQNSKLKHTVCAICGHDDVDTVVYEANFSLRDLNTEIFSARRLPDKLHYRMVRCSHDGLLRSDPVVSPEILEKLYEKSKFTYNTEVPNLTKTYLNALKPVLGQINKNDAILEIGCGNGFILKALQDRGYTNVYGVEPSDSAIEQADHSLKKRILKGFFKKKLFPKKRFRLVIIFQTLDHILNPNTFLQDIYDILESGGFVFAFQHDLGSLSAKILGEKSPIIDIEHTILYEANTLRMIFARNGLLPVKTASEWNWLTLRYLSQLLPIKKGHKIAFLTTIKKGVLSKLFSLTIPLKLGNMSILAKRQ